MAKDSFKPLETIVDKELEVIEDMKKQFKMQIDEMTATSTQGIFFDKTGEDELGKLKNKALSRIGQISGSSQEELQGILREATGSKDGKEMNHLYRKANHRPLISFNRDKDNKKRETSQMLYDRAIADAQNELNQQVRRVVFQTKIKLQDVAKSFKSDLSSLCATTVARVKEKETMLEAYKRKTIVYVIRGSYKGGFSVTQLMGTEEIEKFISANRKNLLHEDPGTWGFSSFEELLECWRAMNKEAYDSGYSDGDADGYNRGYGDGESDGYDRGYNAGSN